MKHKKSLSPVFSATLFEAAAAGAKTCAAIAGRFWLCVPLVPVFLHHFRVTNNWNKWFFHLICFIIVLFLISITKGKVRSSFPREITFIIHFSSAYPIDLSCASRGWRSPVGKIIIIKIFMVLFILESVMFSSRSCWSEMSSDLFDDFQVEK